MTVDQPIEYLSALANAAALLGKVNAYLIWGVGVVHTIREVLQR